MMNKKYYLTLCILFFGYIAKAQVGIGTSDVHPSAIVELKSNTHGFLMPRLTTVERNLISSPTEGLTVYNTERNSIQFFRENVGINSALSGWFDVNCENDINTAVSNLPQGIILDFSDFDNNGQLFPDINGLGTPLTSTTADSSKVGSIGPLPTDLNDAVPTLTNYISFENKNEAGDLPNDDYVFRLKNSPEVYPNSYNASSFLTRTSSHNSDKETDLFIADFATDYTGDFDFLIVAKYDSIPESKKESFFSAGGFLLGNGDDSKNCKQNHYVIKGDAATLFCGHNSDASLDNKIEVDTDFHRFRVKYTSSTTTADFYIDGHLIESMTTTLVIKNFALFINSGQRFAPKSSISFLGLFKNPLSDTDFERFDEFLACKFEVQP